jgi:hypothetical protein
MTGTRRTIRILLALILTLPVAALTPPAARAAEDRLPNLQMVPLHDLEIEAASGGRRLLRFTTIMWNVGSGPLEVFSKRPSTSDPWTVWQRIYNTEGGARGTRTTASLLYAVDGHDHWHVRDMMTYELWPTDAPTTVRRGVKTGFCFFDTTPVDRSLPGAPQSSYYRQEWCGTRNSTYQHSGISIGWGDRYPWFFAYQWVDVTGLPSGDYLLRATVDQPNHFRESNELDNCSYVRIRISATSSAVTVLGRGTSCGASSVTPVNNFPGSTTYDPPRRLSFAAGTYVGYKFNAAGTTLATKPFTLHSPSGASAVRRAIPTGYPSNWFYIVDGVWAGYWIKDTASVNLAQ